MTTPSDPALIHSALRPSLGLAVAAVLGVAVDAALMPHGLTPLMRHVVAIAAFTVSLWVLQVMSLGVASILMVAVLILAGVPPPLALSGFSSPQFWTLLAVLYYGFAMQRTGLARRLSFLILSWFPPTYGGLLTSFLTIGFVLALGIPSMTVRTAIVVPIAWAVVQTLGLERQSRGSALVMLTSIEMAIVPGLAFLYGSLYGPVVESLFRSRGFELSWMGYAQVMTIPTLLCSVLLLLANRLVLAPEQQAALSSSYAKAELRALGPIKGRELVTAAVVVVSIALWATDRLHHQPAFVIGMLALPVFAIAGILRDGDLGPGVPWGLLLFLGGVFSLGNVLQEYKITNWIAGYVVPVAIRFASNPPAFLSVMLLAMLTVRFVDPPGFIALAVLFLAVADVAVGARVPPLVLMAALLFGSTPFWASYQNIWVAMGDGLTAGNGFSASQRVRLATTYAVVSLGTLLLSVGYWKAIGVLE